MKRSLLAGALLTALLLGACGTREPVTLTETDCRTAAVAADFSITLLRNAAKPDKTTLLSPYSVLLALGMAANGAGGRTLEEMEYALGAKTDDLNHWLAACRLAEDGQGRLGQFPLDAAGAGGPEGVPEDDPETV